jgi:predicted transcriptional regulator
MRTQLNSQADYGRAKYPESNNGVSSKTVPADFQGMAAPEGGPGAPYRQRRLLAFAPIREVRVCTSRHDGVTLVAPYGNRYRTMSTTSLKLSEELKQRAVAAAEKKGVSPHAFMVNAIEQAATAAELRASFVGEALAAREQMLSTGKGYDSREVHTYLKARISGNKSAKPKAKSWQS